MEKTTEGGYLNGGGGAEGQLSNARGRQNVNIGGIRGGRPSGQGLLS